MPTLQPVAYRRKDKPMIRQHIERNNLFYFLFGMILEELRQCVMCYKSAIIYGKF